MIDVLSARARRHFYLSRAFKRRPIGSGSDQAFLMALARGPLRVKPQAIFGATPFVIVGGVATRMYMPERFTKDVDILVVPSDFPAIRASLTRAGFVKRGPLGFPNATLGLFGEAWTSADEEYDVLSSEQPWCAEALATPIVDRDGNAIVRLPYLVLMKLDSARGIDQGDLSRMLGALDDAQVAEITAIVAAHLSDPDVASDIEQYAQLGRWEMQGPER